MTRAVINLSNLSHLSTRTRYRLLFTCFILTTAHLFFSASLIRWSSNLSKAVPGSTSQDDASKTSTNVSSKETLPPYGADDVNRPVVPQAKLLKDFFTWNEADIASLTPPVFLPPIPPTPPITDPFPLLSSNLVSRKLRKLLQPLDINSPLHFRHLHPSHPSQQTRLVQQPSRSWSSFSRFGSKSFGRRPDPSLSGPYYTELNPTGMAPLLIGFTRNWPLLLQCVSSYIAAGWPADEIFVVENTGVMDANERGLLGLQNPFFMNRTQLEMLGVNVVVTPTLLTFSQLQNFFAWTALERGWTEYFWSHQDLIVLSYEHRHPSYLSAAGARPKSQSKSQSKSDKSAKAKASSKSKTSSKKSKDDDVPEEYRSLYANALHTLHQYRDPSHPKWAHHFFSYDHLTLVHRDAILSVGGWDTQIPFYGTDCDMYTRLMWAGYAQNESTTAATRVGHILDVNTVFDDIGALFRVPGIKASFPGDPHPNNPRTQRQKGKAGSEVETYANLLSTARRMQRAKYAMGNGLEGRNKSWQVKQQGGQGEPFYRDAEGFEAGVEMWIEAGRAVFSEKWGHRGCDIARKWVTGKNKGNGNGLNDAWRVERDWDADKEGGGGYGGGW